MSSSGHKHHECTQCGSHTTLRCSVCHEVYYCSVVCQRRHWDAGHRTACGGLDEYVAQEQLQIIHSRSNGPKSRTMDHGLEWSIDRTQNNVFRDIMASDEISVTRSARGQQMTSFTVTDEHAPCSARSIDLDAIPMAALFSGPRARVRRACMCGQCHVDGSDETCT